LNTIIIIIALAVLPDPAIATVAIADSPDGLLCTDGRSTGLFLTDGEEELETLSLEPGAGRNVVVADDGILFKECPAGELQRIVSIPKKGERTVLIEKDYFSGPFRCTSNTFLIAERNTIIEYNLQAEELRSWSIRGFPAWVSCSGGSLFYTGESGGLEMIDILSEKIFNVPSCREITFSKITAGPGGLLLAEKSPFGFIVLDPSGNVILEISEVRFPSWTDEGSILCSYIEFEGMEPVAGRVCSINLPNGDEFTLTDEGIPLYPLKLADGDIVWTGADDGELHGIDVPCLPALETDSGTDDPDAHIDVPYMHQRWDTPDWFNGSWSCGPTSCMMAVQYYMMLTPDSIWASHPSPGHWSLWGNYIPVEYTFLGYTYDELGPNPDSVYVPGAHGFICPDGGAWWNKMVTFLNRHNVSSAWAGTSWSTLTGQINGDYPVVCSSNVLGHGHIILLNGYYSNHTIVVNDPYGDANESGWGNYYNGKDVLYDWPGYNNGHVQIGVSQLFYAQAQIPAEPDTLVDDCCRGFYRFANCRYWHLTGSGYNGNAWWTYSTGALPDTCIAEWHPVLPAEGNYDVSVYIPPNYASATGIYELHAATGIEEINIDQGLYSDQWVLLGTFSVNYDSYLRLGDYTGTGGKYIAFDAALFSPSGTGIRGDGSIAQPQNIRLWPNPCGELVSILLPSGNEGVSVVAYDITGRLVSNISYREFTEIMQLDVSSFSTGLYLLRIILNDSGGSTFTRCVSVCR
jgi:hypothetical protein